MYYHKKGSVSSSFEDQSFNSKYPSTLEDFESTFKMIKSRDLVEFDARIPHCLRSHSNISAIDATRAVLEHQLQKGDHVRHTSHFQTTAAYIRNELEFIQAKMLKTTTTDTGIQDLEERAQKAGGLLESLPRLEDQHEQWEALSDKYKLICAWVEEVRIWFVEAERIRKWIEARIVTLEGRRSTAEALDEVELDYTKEEVERLNQEHEALEKEVETFDKQDMARLRAHVKALTGSNKDLSPADTTTIEITFTTLMTLDRLMHLLRRRSYELQILTLRMYWEQEYNIAVGWVRSMLEQVKRFIDREARWRPTRVCSSEDKSEVIEKLIEFEKQCAIFDQGQFTTTVNMYQDLDDSCHLELPNHLESRQVALEEAFETLTNRIAFARQVVEQYLVVTDFLDHADELKTKGERLRQEITQAEQQLLTNSDLGEKVSVFQENAVRLVTGLATRIPYPESIHPSDQQENDDANETIRMVIGARKSALILLGEALDQVLNSYRRTLQLQKRAKQLKDELNRLTGWVDERMRAMQKAKVDVFIGKCALDEVDLSRLRKERDGQVAKLKGIRENDVKKLNENVQILHNSLNHTVVDSLCLGLEELEQHLHKLDKALSRHSLGLDILEKRILWESQYAKSLQWITHMTSALWDFTAKKAQWRPNNNHPMFEWELVEQEFKEIQSKMTVFETEQFDSTQQGFRILLEGFSLMEQGDVPLTNDDDTMTPEHIKRRQETLDRNFTHLKDLCLFTQAVLDQHMSLDVFSTHASTLSERGEKLMTHLRQLLDDLLYITQENSLLEQSVEEFSQDVLDLWTHMGSTIPYPQCNEEARATRPSTEDDEISTNIANVVYDTYVELQNLVNQIKDLLVQLKTVLEHRKELESCIENAALLTDTMKQTKQEFSSLYDFNYQLYADTMQRYDKTLDTKILKDKMTELTSNHYEPLMRRMNTLEALDTAINKSRLPSSIALLNTAYKELREYVELFTHQVQCYNTRLHWESLLAADMFKLNSLQERIHDTVNEKNFWLCCEDNEHDDELLEKLVKDMAKYSKELEHYVDTDFAASNTAYIDMTAAFDKLGKPSSNLQNRQHDLTKLVKKLQNYVTQQTSEIDIIQTRYDWESRADQELKAYSEFESKIESYSRHHARWSLQQKDSTTELNELKATFVTHTETAKQLINEFDALEQPTEATSKRKSAIETAKDRLQQNMDFVNQVLAQSDAIRQCLSRIHDLETRAEMLKSQFLAADDIQDGFDDTFKAYREDVQQLDPTSIIPYPKTQNKDFMAYNTAMADMIHARCVRLDELVNILESILKTKEQVSRRRAAEASYLAEATTVKEWIQSKWSTVDQISAMQDDLYEAVQIAEATQSAVLAYSSSVSALRASSLKYMAMMEEEDTLRTIQTDVDAQYDNLCDHVQKVKDDVLDRLRHAEWNQLLDEFYKVCDQLKQEIKMAAVEDVTEDVIADWQTRVQQLEEQQVEPIEDRAATDHEARDRVLKALSDLKVLMHYRITEANQYRWKLQYLKEVDALEHWMDATHQAINTFQMEQGLIQKDDSMNAAKAAYETLYASVESHVDEYDKIRSSYKFLQLNKVKGVDKRQQDIECQWKETQEKVNHAKQLVDQIIQWASLFDNLSIEDELKTIVKRLDAFVADDDVLETLPLFFEQEREQLSSLIDSLDTSLTTAQNLSSQAPEGAKVKENLDHFQSKYNQLHDEVIEAQDLLAQKEKLAQGQVDTNTCQTMVSTVKSEVENQIDLWKTRLEKLQQAMKDTALLESYYLDGRSTMQTKQKELIHQSTHTIQPALIRLKDEHQIDIQPMEKELSDSLDQLAAAIQTETNTQDMIRKTLGHAKSAEDISTWIDHCQQAMNEIEANDEGAERSMMSLVQKMDDFAPVMASFDEMTNDIDQIPVITEEEEVWNGLVRAVHERTDDIKKQWTSLEKLREKTLQDIQRTAHSITMLRKIKGVMALLGDTRDYLESIKIPKPKTTDKPDIEADAKEDHDTAVYKLSDMLRQPEAENYIKNLSAVEEDVKTRVDQEMKELENMVIECHEGDVLIHQYQETKDAVDRLRSDLTEKETELKKALDLGKFLTITDDLEILQSSLEEAIGKSVPVTLMGRGLSRTDLQAKLIELDARFKYYENNIVTTLKSAKEFPLDEQLPEKEIAANYLKTIEKRWELLKKQYKTRKIELSRTVDSKEYQRDQEQQARIRKSSLPTRKASSLLRAAGDMSRLSPNPSTSSSSSGSLRHSVSRHNHQPSKSATHIKTRPRLPRPPLNAYVADPDNDLDMEIGRIVNNAPYRVKVKMVPGEVGRYWFGDMNPKLAYCRVLKSKMVMVRVGGGWAELSQFLRDHALLEGDFIPKMAEAIPEEPSIQEGFIETRRAKPMPRSLSSSTRLPTGSPSHSVSSTTSGYKDGDKFIAMDEHGNQLEVKMRRFSNDVKDSNDYTRRRMARKKDKLNKDNAV